MKLKQWLRFMMHCTFSGDRVTEYTSRDAHWQINDVVTSDSEKLTGTHIILWKRKIRQNYIYYLLEKRA
jgi:hypothetical protein